MMLFWALSWVISVASASPNVLVIMADDLGYADLGYQGGTPTTPHLDAMAESGLRFDQFYVHGVGHQTRAAMLTGRFPHHFGFHVSSLKTAGAFPTETTTLPELMKEAGYRTFLFGRWGLGNKVGAPMEHGFDHHYGNLNTGVNHYTHMSRKNVMDWVRDEEPAFDEGYSSTLIAEEAISTITAEAEQPFFAVLSFLTPSRPFGAPQDFLKANLSYEKPERRAYEAMVESMDHEIGRVLEALKTADKQDNTIVFFLSDNGGDHDDVADNGPLRSGKDEPVYDGAVLVPAWAYMPGGTAKVVTVPVHAVDVFATVLKQARIKQPNDVDGVDLTTITDSTPRLFPLAVDGGEVALRRGPYKYIGRSEEQQKPEEWKPSSVELYDITKDPGEQNNLAESLPAVVESFQRDARQVLSEAPTVVVAEQEAGQRRRGARGSGKQRGQSTMRSGKGSKSGRGKASGQQRQ